MVALLSFAACRPKQQIVISGVVLRQDPDVSDQVPIADAEISATTGAASVVAKSDAAGLFRLNLPPGTPQTGVGITIHHPGYEAIELNASTAGEIVMVRMRSSAPTVTASEKHAEIAIANMRIRYSAKATTTRNVGSVAKTFEVNNAANVPCNGVQPCSPDSRWKASMASYSLDAGGGNEFRNIRLSCIAGPCPFTHIESEKQSQDDRMLTVSVRNWADTATFLLEAEVSQTQMTDIIRQSFPARFGSTMSFTLPQGSEGPSIEAELDGHDIVFPLGPDLIVSWANCTVNTSADQGNLYRCELKPGYRFAEPVVGR